MSLKKFVTEEELDEKRRIRQEEWERIRTADQPLECPAEEPVDQRSLYDKLAEQKQKKDDEYAEQHRLSNEVKGLEEDEVAFLDHVSQRQNEIKKERLTEEQSILQQMKQENVIKIEEKSQKTTKASSSKKSLSTETKSQSALLANAVKRKSCEMKSSGKDGKTLLDNSATDKDEPQASKLRIVYPRADSVLYVRPSLTISQNGLPGISSYSDNSSASSSSEDDDINAYVDNKSTAKVRVVQKHDCD